MSNIVTAEITSVIEDTSTQYCEAYQNTPNICRGNNTWLHAAFLNSTDGVSTHTQVFYSQSQDNGSTWSAPTQITSYTYCYVSYDGGAPSILIDKYSHIWIFWATVDTRIPAYYFNISYVKSTDNGSTWSSIANAYSVTSYWTRHPTIATDWNGNVHLAFRGQIAAYGSIENIRYRKYTRTGAGTGSWGATVNITTGTTGSVNKETPAIHVDVDNNVYVAWGFKGTDPGTRPYIKKYTNLTSTWGSEICLDTVDTDAFGQLYPVIATNNTGGVHVVFYGIPNGGTNRVVRYISSTNGITWGAVKNLSSAAQHSFSPSIAISTDNAIHVVWHKSISPDRNIYYAKSTDNGATWTSESAIISDAGEDRYPILLYATHPVQLNGNRTDRPKTGYAFLWTHDTTLEYYASTDLTWESITAPIPPAGPADLKPTISFAGDSTTNGTKLYNNFINTNLTSTYGTFNNSFLYAGTGELLGPDIYRYDGATWTTNYDGSGAKYIIDITEYNGKLYAAVNGYNAGDGDILVSDGATWTISYNGTTEIGYYSLCEFNGLLYAGGKGYVKVFDGSSWNTSVSSSNSYNCMHEFGGDLYAGTYDSGSVVAGDVWKFDGATWTKVFDSSYDWIYALEEYNGSLWAGMGGLSGNEADVFNSSDGSTWTIQLDAGTGHSIWDLLVYNGSLFASQGLTATEGDIWRYNGSAWLKTWDLATYVRLFALGVYDGKLWTGTYPYARIFSSTDGITWNLEKTLSSGTQEIQCFYATNISNHYALLDFDRDLLELMTMDIAAGTTIYDNSTYNHNGAKNGNAIQNSLGVFGDCFSFDGDGDYIQIPNTASWDDIDATTTVSLWAKSDEDYGSFIQNNRGLWGFYVADEGIYGCINKNDHKVEIYNRIGIANTYKAISAALPTTNYITNWHHYVFVFNATTISCYIDGVYSGQGAFGSSYPNLDNLVDGFVTTVGRGTFSASTWDWKGDIDEFIVFNRSLTSDEIQSLYDADSYQYNHNFTGLTNGNYTFQGCAVNSLGLVNQTAQRWSNIDMQYAPVVLDETPTNGSTNADLFQICSVTVYDQNSDTMNITWQTNSSGVWLTKHVDHTVASGSTESWQYTTFSVLSHIYYWRVYIDDGLFNVSYLYHLTTGGSYFAIDNLVNNSLDWNGIAGAAYWCNSTGTHSETMKVTMSVGPLDEVIKAGIWMGDLSIAHRDPLSPGWNNNILIPYWAIDACPSDLVEDVFDSIHDSLVNVTELGTGLWWNRTGTPTLIHIIPDHFYNVFVNNSCEIYIVTGVQVNASNISVQFSGDNISWGINTRSFDDGGSEIFVNQSLWINANGCYGINPWGAPLSGVTAYMYARFKLNLPSYLPSNYTYFSLSAIDWKLNFYALNVGTDVIEPLILPASLPSSGHASLKWNLPQPTALICGFDEPIAKDVNGDGAMEIFWAGYDNTYSPWGQRQRVTCYNGTTGATIWSVPYGVGYNDIHIPIGVYDFDKDGDYEVIIMENYNTVMVNALTGATEWNVPVMCGFHHFAFIDTGPIVYVYVSGHDATPPYDATVKKLRGDNGSVVASASMYYSCYGGTSIADLDGNGKYEILISDRGQDKYPGTPAKSLRCYDEDLNLLWYALNWTCSSHAPMIVDVDGDGKLEVIIGRQGGSGVNSGLYIYNADGSIYASQYTIVGSRFHTRPTIYDVDYDGVLEIMDGYGSNPNIISLNTFAIEATIPYSMSEPPNVGNVILDAGESDTRSEIITATSPPFAYKYNTTTHVYDKIFTFTGSRSYSSMTQDLDHDGYNEVLFHHNGSMSVWETRVPANIPRTRTELALDGERRLNNGEYYQRPYYGEGLMDQLAFGGSAGIPGILITTFLSGANSSNDPVETQGFYNLGDYRTMINISVYCPNPWDVTSMYIHVLNSTGVLYDNITGLSSVTANATHKIFYKLYNPTTNVETPETMDLNVYATITYSGVIMFSGNISFNDVFTIYSIDPSYNWTSIYNITLNSVNLSWNAGNYSDRQVVVRKTGTSYPTSPLDGTIVQNSTATTYNESGVYTARAYAVFGYNATTGSYSAPFDIPWGAMGINCYNESNPSQNLTFNLFITNEQGTQTYVANGCINTQYLDFTDIPTGTRTVIQVTSTGYKVRYYYMDLLPNMLHSLNAYLPSDKITGGGGGTSEPTCVQRLYIDSKTITSYTTDQTVNLTFALDTLVDVQLFNRSLYGTYGGWYFIPADKYTTSTTQVIVNKTVLDKNSTILKVTYYYEDCTTIEGEPGLYLITVWDYYDQPIQDVKVEFKVYINTTDQYEPVSILYTDSMGQVNLYLIPFSIYKVVCSKDGYVTSISDYIPDPNIRVHTFKLNAEEPSGTEYVDIYHNLSWTLEPKNRYQSGPFLIWFNITSLDDQLEWYRMKIDLYNSSSLLWINIYNGNTTDQAGGGTLSFLMPNTTGRYRVQTYFKKIGFPIYEIGYSEGGCDIFHISGGGGLADNAMIQAIPGWVYMAIVLIIAAFVMAFALPMAGIGTGFIGIGIIGFAMILKPDLIMDDGTTGWVILTITTLVYSLGVFVWSRI